MKTMKKKGLSSIKDEMSAAQGEIVKNAARNKRLVWLANWQSM